MSQGPMQWYCTNTEEPSDKYSHQAQTRLLSDGDEPTTNQPPNHYRLYELIVAIVLLYSATMFFIWQAGDRRLSLLEDEVAALQNELVQIQNESKKQSAAATIAIDKTEESSLQYRVETEDLIFETDRNLVNTVKSIADQLNFEYQQLRYIFGLDTARNAPKLRVIISPSETESSISENSITVSSPEKLEDRFGHTSADTLAFSIYAKMSLHILQEAQSQQDIKPQWGSFAKSLTFYLQRENGPNPNWRQDDEYLRRRHLAQGYSLTFDDVALTQPQGRSGLWIQPNNIAHEFADPLIEFIIESYGQEKLPQLFRAFKEHETWDSVSPAVFEVSATAFESSWHDYLAQNYPR